MVYLKSKLRLPAIQVALDYTNPLDALRLASYAREFDNVIIEAGTPLIKSEGARIIALLKTVSSSPVVADMKTIDAAEVEVKLASNWGADVITVLGVADDATIIKALSAARKYSIDVQSDLISVKEPLDRALELARLGVNIIGFHAGIDVQKTKDKRADIFINNLEELKNSLSNNVLISVAGGIKPSEVPKFVRAGADIIVIGSAITSSPNPLQQLKTAVSYIQ